MGISCINKCITSKGMPKPPHRPVFFHILCYLQHIVAVLYLLSLDWRKASIVSVSHFSMPKVCCTLWSSSFSLMIGSAPRAYLMLRADPNWRGLSPFTNACTWGYRPNFHPQTASSAYGYVSISVSLEESSWQHPMQPSLSLWRLNLSSSSQELHIKLLVKPIPWHSSRNCWLHSP